VPRGLKEFHRYQKRSSKRSLIFLLLLLIFGAILVLIYKPRNHEASPSYPPVDSNTDFDRVISGSGSVKDGIDVVDEVYAGGGERRNAQRFLGRGSGRYGSSTGSGELNF
jgi:hypothetical protein